MRQEYLETQNPQEREAVYTKSAHFISADMLLLLHCEIQLLNHVSLQRGHREDNLLFLCLFRSAFSSLWA